MSKVNDILVGLQYRGRFSVGEERQRLGYSAFHWSIAIQGAHELHRYDVTDGIVLDPQTHLNVNEEENWIYRYTQSKSTEIVRHLGFIKIGRLGKKHSITEVRDLFAMLPLPEKDANPRQSCVTWTVDAIRALQEIGILSRFEMGPMMDRVLRHGDDRIAKSVETPEVINYQEETEHRSFLSFFRLQ